MGGSITPAAQEQALPLGLRRPEGLFNQIEYVHDQQLQLQHWLD